MALTPEKLYANAKRVGECLEWTGPRNVRGYGRAYSHYANGRGHGVYAHRAAWEFEVGPIPSGMDVCHHCDNPPCIRIEHLFVGTRSDNMRDAEAKGRGIHNVPKGSRHYAAKVTPEIAASIKRGAEAGVANAAMARHFGVGASTVGRVIAGNHWTAA